MAYEYDLFEKFPDGSSLWRACVFGLENTRFQLRALAERSQNQFYALNVVNGKIVYSGFHQGEFHASPKIGKRSGAAAA